MTNNQLWTRWTPANALSEMIGMGLTFATTGLFITSVGEGNTVWGIDMAFKMSAVWQSVLLMVGTLFVTGAVVGGIHGLFLVRLKEKG